MRKYFLNLRFSMNVGLMEILIHNQCLYVTDLSQGCRLLQAVHLLTAEKSDKSFLSKGFSSNVR